MPNVFEAIFVSPPPNDSCLRGTKNSAGGEGHPEVTNPYARTQSQYLTAIKIVFKANLPNENHFQLVSRA